MNARQLHERAQRLIHPPHLKKQRPWDFKLLFKQDGRVFLVRLEKGTGRPPGDKERQRLHGLSHMGNLEMDLFCAQKTMLWARWLLRTQAEKQRGEVMK